MFRIVSRTRRTAVKRFAAIGPVATALLLASPAFAQIGGDRVSSAIHRGCREPGARRLVDETTARTCFPVRQRADLQNAFSTDARTKAPLSAGGSGMKLVWVGALLLLIASVASLISNRQSGGLIDES